MVWVSRTGTVRVDRDMLTQYAATNRRVVAFNVITVRARPLILFKGKQVSRLVKLCAAFARDRRQNHALYDLSSLPRVRTIRDFDQQYTAAAHGFASAEDYYYKSSSVRVIEQIRLPTLIIHAHDDPFIPFTPLRDEVVAANPYILLLAPDRGGHVAFISARRNGEDRFWAENRAVEFCELALEALDGMGAC